MLFDFLLNFVHIMLSWSPKLSSLLKLGWSGTVFIVPVEDIKWSPTNKLFQMVAGSDIFKNFNNVSTALCSVVITMALANVKLTS